MFYPNKAYYEWYTHTDTAVSTSNSVDVDVEKGIDSIIQTLNENNFDGILGFSQGAQMLTVVLHRLQQNKVISRLKYVVCIGGTCPQIHWLSPTTDLNTTSPTPLADQLSDAPPPLIQSNSVNVSVIQLPIPSLHIIGHADPYKDQSIQLYERFYSSNTSTCLYHNQDHRIPTMDTGIYPLIYDWLCQHTDRSI